jgi:hypothetical protein
VVRQVVDPIAPIGGAGSPPSDVRARPVESSSNRHFLFDPNPEIPEPDPDFIAVAYRRLQRIQTTGAGAVLVLHSAVQGETAVVAGAEERILPWGIIYQAAGMWTDYIESLNP